MVKREGEWGEEESRGEKRGEEMKDVMILRNKTTLLLEIDRQRMQRHPRLEPVAWNFNASCCISAGGKLHVGGRDVTENTSPPLLHVKHRSARDLSPEGHVNILPVSCQSHSLISQRRLEHKRPLIPGDTGRLC